MTAGIHPAALDPERLLAECEVRFTRRSGPGGQNRNKVETAVILTHRPTGLTAEASERRTQAENRRAALHRLRRRLAADVRRPAPAEPSDFWKRRCRAGRIAVAADHDEFPTLLAEALDVLAAHNDDPKVAARALGCSTTQLIRLLALEPKTLTRLNELRQHRGLHPLKP